MLGLEKFFLRRAAPGGGELVVPKTPMGLDLEFLVPSENAVDLVAWTDQPAAAAFVNADTTKIRLADLSAFSECRLIVHQKTAGAATAVADVKFSPTFTTTLSNYSNLCAPTARVSLAGTGVVVGAWVPIVENARGDMYVSVIGSGGDGAVDPELLRVNVQFRTR